MELSFSEVFRTFQTSEQVYAYFHHYLHHRSMQILIDHRKYIVANRKGFGEDAFHAMWFLLLSEIKPVHMLEIGVYRGQIVSLWALINKYLNRKYDVHGISPFSSRGDSVTEYPCEIDYWSDTLNTFKDWDIKPPILLKALSTEQKSVDLIQSKAWDLIYIDGSHDFEIVLKDYRLCSKNLNKGGVLVLDDASLYRDYKPRSFAFAGHSGPSRVARDYADREMEFMGAVGHNNVYRKKT